MTVSPDGQAAVSSGGQALDQAQTQAFAPGSLPGAVAAEGLDAGSDAHYGNPAVEQRALLSGRAFSVLGHRGVIRVSGQDRLTWLHSLMSQDMLTLTDGESRRGLFLTAQGRIEHDVDIVGAADSVYLLTSRTSASELSAFLTRMKFMLRVEVEDLSAESVILGFARWSAVPAPARSEVESAALAVFDDPWALDAPGGYSYGTREAAEHLDDLSYSWTEVAVPLASAAACLESLSAAGLTPAGAMAVDALRIHALKPRAGADTDVKAIPHELNLLRNSVHLAKGCYKGQETIARVHNLGHPPRRLVMLHLDGSGHTLPAVGSAVFLQGQEDGRPIGAVTSVALHVEAGPIALALVKRSADPAAILSVVDDEDVYPAAQLAVVASDAGSVVGRTKDLRRLS